MSSGGTDWILVEIEPADAKLLAKNGEYGIRVRQGLQQLKDWKSWLNKNHDYAIRSRPNGLGLMEVSTFEAWLVVGRRASVTDRFNQLRQQTWEGDGIKIQTFDRLIEQFRARAEFWDGFDPFKSIAQYATGTVPPWERDK